jgi:outer membrane immunogenic protein
MKKLLLAATALVSLTAGTAGAADLAVKAPLYKAPPPVVVFNWTGCYIGGQVGAQWGSWTADVDYPGVVASRDFDHKANFIGGGQIGCNYQPIGTNFVFGVEGDIVGANDKFSGEVFRGANGIDHFDAAGKIGTQGSLRLRVGAAWDRFLLYVAGGATWAKLTADHSVVRDGVGAATFETSPNRTGWNIGVGGEYAFVNNWTIGVEYRYTDYGSFDYSIPAGAFPAAFFAHTASADHIRTSDVRVRLNYLFNSGPVVAKY